MRTLLPIVSICLLLAALSQVRTRNDNALVSTGRKDAAIWFTIAIIMGVFAGLRTRYNDTTTYLWSYELIDTSKSIFYGLHFTPSESDGFQIVTRIMKNIGFTPNTFLMAFALFDYGVIMWFVRKYSDEPLLGLFLIFSMGVFTFNLAAIMQSTATALAVIGVDRAIRKKWVSFVIFVLLAASFHTYAIMFLLVPLLSFQPWSKKTYWMLGLFLIIGLFLPQMLGIVVSVTSAMGEKYDLDSFSGAGVNIFRFLVVSVPVVLSFIVRKKLDGQTTRAQNFIINLSMLNAEIMFVALFGTANYFGRLANYFLVFQVISLPLLLSYFKKDIRRLLTVLMIIGYMGYFAYAYFIKMDFDVFYDSMSLIDYIRSLG